MKAVRGTHDIMGAEIEQWHSVEEVFRTVSAAYAYQEIRTPIFEHTDVFRKGVGEQTDIVGKEMYTFEDRGGDSLTLRPEMTAPIVRCTIENNLVRHNPVVRLWYAGPQFRYERPQKGRYRQFHQYGAECIGSAHPESDVEIILLCADVIRSVGITTATLEINSLGTPEVRARYRELLVAYLTEHQDQLSHESRVRLAQNPLRVLDSKDEADRLIVQAAPSILDVLDEDSSQHFSTVLSMLDAAGVAYTINPRLVRGLDYYSHSVFEFTTNSLGSQNAIGGGGRYDPLFAMLGGSSTPAVGFSIGIERLILLREHELGTAHEPVLQGAYLAAIGDAARLPVHLLATRLRRKGIRVVTDLLRRSMSGQMKEANRASVLYTVIIGDDELASHCAVIKNMKTGEQTTVPTTDVESVLINA